ncbi:MAG: hypothetical protein IJR51_07745 [Clostridia bacterium]|nr:hypothetical protein [Clostridia bacterium]MBR5424150.1 hypothetical protein [Clostridia bacterium]
MTERSPLQLGRDGNTAFCCRALTCPGSLGAKRTPFSSSSSLLVFGCTVILAPEKELVKSFFKQNRSGAFAEREKFKLEFAVLANSGGLCYDYDTKTGGEENETDRR